MASRSRFRLVTDSQQSCQSSERILAYDGDVLAGTVTGLRRPDNRTFLRFDYHDATAFQALASAATEAFRPPLCVMVDASNLETIGTLGEAGFAVLITEERVRIRFDAALRMVRRATTPAGYSLHGADAVDKDVLFDLDTKLRNMVPGTDGWQGGRDIFDREIADSPPFDPCAYLVAVHELSGEYAGLVRMWRNPDEPRFGLIGVLPHHRSAPVAAALLKQALAAASQWGSETFVAETSLSNDVIYPKLKRLSAERLSRFHQMEYRSSRSRPRR